MTDGGLTLNIPLASSPPRGSLDLSFFIRYSSKQWQLKFPLARQTMPYWMPAPNTGAQVVSSVDWWTQKTSSSNAMTSRLSRPGYSAEGQTAIHVERCRRVDRVNVIPTAI